MTLKQTVQNILLKAINSIGTIENPPPVKLEYARDEKFGDYACTVAMDKEWRESISRVDNSFNNPRKFAEAILSSLRTLPEFETTFEDAQIAGPGFINLRIANPFLFAWNKTASNAKETYGKTEKEKRRNIIFEFVSANPTGPLNIVSARSAALGDSCCNLLEAAGESVSREYYVNDYGNQVILLGHSCLLRRLESHGVTLKFSTKTETGETVYPSGPGLRFPAEGYHGEYLIDITAEVAKKNRDLNVSEEAIKKAKALETADSSDPIRQLGLESLAESYGKSVTEHFLETHKRDLERFRVKFDNFFSERSLHEAGAVMNVRKSLKEHLYTDEDGKEYFRSTDYGDDKDRVIVREDGRPTYLLADIAYHHTKIERKYTDIINIWGPDHHGYISRLSGAVAAMGYDPERFSILIAQQVNLLDGGEPVVMSKRTGKFITMETLLEEIPIDVSRYFFVMRSFEAHLDFDFNDAKDTTEKNPYYYVAYAHARIRSIFRKAAERGIIDDSIAEDPSLLANENPAPFQNTPERRRLLWLVARFPEEVSDAAESLEPHRLINYLYSIATALSKFYAPAENRIIEQTREEAISLLVVLHAVSLCIKNGLKLLGMEAPERMVKETE